MAVVHRCKKIKAGHYIYRGFEVRCLGYFEAEHRIVWECVDEYGCGFGHSFTLRDCKQQIDWELDSEEGRRHNEKIKREFNV